MHDGEVVSGVGLRRFRVLGTHDARAANGGRTVVDGQYHRVGTLRVGVVYRLRGQVTGNYRGPVTKVQGESERVAVVVLGGHVDRCSQGGRTHIG